MNLRWKRDKDGERNTRADRLYAAVSGENIYDVATKVPSLKDEHLEPCVAWVNNIPFAKPTSLEAGKTLCQEIADAVAKAEGKV